MALEIHEAIVTRVEDDDLGLEIRGAIFFEAPTLLEDQEYPIPAEPCFPFVSKASETDNGNQNTGSAGFFWVPKPGDFVEIMLDDSVSHPNPVYRCMFYNNVNDLSRDFKKNYGNRLGLKSNSGHILLFDDTKGQRTINLEHTFGGRLNLDDKGNIKLTARKVTKRDKNSDDKDELDAQFHELCYDFVNKKIILHDDKLNSMVISPEGIVITDTNKNSMTMTKDGIVIEDVSKNKMTMVAGGTTITTPSGVKVELFDNGKIALTAKNAIIDIDGNTGKVHLNAALVDVGANAAFQAILGPLLVQWLKTHTHTSTSILTPSTSSPPNQPIPASMLSGTVKIQS